MLAARKSPPTTKLFSPPSRDIARQQALLLDLRALERTMSTRITLFQLAVWLVYLGLWYFGVVSGGECGESEAREEGSEGATDIRGADCVRVVRCSMPKVVVFFRRIIAQRTKFEDIKTMTNFYETCELLFALWAVVPGFALPVLPPRRWRQGRVRECVDAEYAAVGGAGAERRPGKGHCTAGGWGVVNIRARECDEANVART
ncbi:hypothetical protein B0H19DRAFT_1274319 [Mycena capillaripes]|nr:hypothetical protein B0H19DRAFT_1274319 [Mycena capillaripes]